MENVQSEQNSFTAPFPFFNLPPKAQPKISMALESRESSALLVAAGQSPHSLLFIEKKDHQQNSFFNQLLRLEEKNAGKITSMPFFRLMQKNN